MRSINSSGGAVQAAIGQFVCGKRQAATCGGGKLWLLFYSFSSSCGAGQ